MRPFIIGFIIASCCTMMAAPRAQAQYDDAENNAVEATAGDTNAARLQVRIAELEEQVRKLQGTIEQAAHEGRQLKGQLDKSVADIQYRLDAVEKKQAVVPVPVAATTEVPKATEPAVAEGEPGTKEHTSPPPPRPSFATPRDQYNYAFKLLNQAQYTAAGKEFASFTHDHPNDPLIGNAYYWLGETYYVRRDYVQAADNFRQGYESMPTGPKAADNLLKLAMALGAQKSKDKEACVVLKQVAAKFARTSVKSRAEQEMNRIGCD